MSTMKDKMKVIADTYGYDAQARQLIEEMAELTVALNKEWRVRQRYAVTNDYRKSIVEEIADVEIMLEQIKYILDCDGEVFIEKIKKVDRQIERLKADGKSV